MYAALLTLIYLAFISLGLPDSLLGTAWPVMQRDFQVSYSYAGIVAMIISLGTITASLSCARLMQWMSTGVITTVSVLISALSLWGFSLCPSFAWVCVMAIPYGLSGGAVDAVLNNYVAAHYSARHMHWLHASWGVGATLSPIIMGFALVNAGGWQSGYMIIFWAQLTLAVILLLSIKLWRRKDHDAEQSSPTEEKHEVLGFFASLKIRGVKPILISFAAYCGLENATGIWAASYLVEARCLAPESAAFHASLYFMGIMIGRMLGGIIAQYFSHSRLIFMGAALIISGMLLTQLPWNSTLWLSFLMVGIGCAPIYPSIIHATPILFGKEKSLSIIGIQMGCAYMGSCLAPPLFGFISSQLSMSVFPFFVVLLAAAMILSYSRLSRL